MAGTADDIPIGSGTTLAVGEKSETSGLASGDLEIVFGNWAVLCELTDTRYTYIVVP